MDRSFSRTQQSVTSLLFAALITTPILLSAFGCSTLADRSKTDRATQADLVLRGGAVYTVDAARSWAEAVAIRGEEIVYVGSDAGVERYIGANTQRVDLAGAMVLPGFQDAHIHPIGAGINLLTLSLNDLDTAEQYLEALAAYASANPNLKWITGGGWSLDAFAPSGIPSRDLIDAIVPDRPVYLKSADGHTAWVNSNALELAGITRDTPDPAGGRIERDPDTGEAVGALQEKAGSLVSEIIPPITPEQAEAGLAKALEVLNAYGVTAFQDASTRVAGPEAFRNLDAYRALDERGELSARVVVSLWWESTEGREQIPRLLKARTDYTKGRLEATSVKIMQDGILENHTAVLLEPYIGGAGGRGESMVDPEALKAIVTQLDAEGFQVHFHAIGDGAIRECLDSLESARDANGNLDNRHHISHIELFNPEDIARFRELDVVANFQPLWATADPYITDLTLPFIGPERGRWLYPIGSLFRSGAVVAFGSDWYVSTANPLEEIEVAITRKGPADEDWEVFIPEERIALRDALAAFTINAAYVNHREDRTGSIEVGKLADLIVVDRNLFAIDPAEISESRVILTLVGGEVVHGDLQSVGARRAAQNR
jgi:predicted amidohydrolase YtcJ